MMKIFFTADCHFGHGKIILYTHRPYKNVNHMDEELIRRWNKTVSGNDLVYHVGDFAFKNSGQKFEQRLNGSIVHIAGNHDRNNQVKTLITSADMEFGNKLFLVRHHPPVEPEDISDVYDGILCGHVHDHWKVNIYRGCIPIINVGTDVWDFTPVSIASLLKFYDYIKNHAECLDHATHKR